MEPQCESVGKYILPIFRAMIAKELVQKHHLSQTTAAKKLGTSQAAVSQYLSSKRAFKGAGQVEEFLPKIRFMAQEEAQKIAAGDEDAALAVDFCRLCSSLCRRRRSDGCGPKPDYYI